MKQRETFYRFKGYNIYIYHKKGKMQIAHMRPHTIIKGFLYKSKGVFSNSYFADFYFFKISWAKAPKIIPDEPTCGRTVDASKKTPNTVCQGNFNFSEEDARNSPKR